MTERAFVLVYSSFHVVLLECNLSLNVFGLQTLRYYTNLVTRPVLTLLFAITEGRVDISTRLLFDNSFSTLHTPFARLPASSNSVLVHASPLFKSELVEEAPADPAAPAFFLPVCPAPFSQLAMKDTIANDRSAAALATFGCRLYSVSLQSELFFI